MRKIILCIDILALIVLGASVYALPISFGKPPRVSPAEETESEDFQAKFLVAYARAAIILPQNHSDKNLAMRHHPSSLQDSPRFA